MNYLKIYSLSIFGFLLLIMFNTALVKRKFEKSTEKALEDYSMLPNGIKVIDKVILGREEDTLRPGAISLICTDQKDVLLFVQDSRTNYREGAGGSGKGDFKGYNLAGERGYVEISNMIPLSRGYFYTYMSDSLSSNQIAEILKILKIEKLHGISIYTFDGNDSFNSKFDPVKVERLINNCQS